MKKRYDGATEIITVGGFGNHRIELSSGEYKGDASTAKEDAVEIFRILVGHLVGLTYDYLHLLMDTYEREALRPEMNTFDRTIDMVMHPENYEAKK